MSRIKKLFKKITSQSKLMVIAGWVTFLLGQSLSPDLLLTKVFLLSVARVVP